MAIYGHVLPSADSAAALDRRSGRDRQGVQGPRPPHRVAVVNLLVRAGFPVCVCDLTAALGWPSPRSATICGCWSMPGCCARTARHLAYYSVDRDAMRRLATVVALEEPEPAAMHAGPDGRRWTHQAPTRARPSSGSRPETRSCSLGRSAARADRAVAVARGGLRRLARGRGCCCGVLR